METPRARTGFLPPSSPAGTAAAPSGSPPMRDFGLLPGPQSADRTRGASFSAGGGTPVCSKDFFATEGNIGGQLGRAGRGSAPIGLTDHVTSLERCGGHILSLTANVEYCPKVGCLLCLLDPVLTVAPHLKHFFRQFRPRAFVGALQ